MVLRPEIVCKSGQTEFVRCPGPLWHCQGPRIHDNDTVVVARGQHWSITRTHRVCKAEFPLLGPQCPVGEAKPRRNTRNSQLALQGSFGTPRHGSMIRPGREGKFRKTGDPASALGKHKRNTRTGTPARTQKKEEEPAPCSWNTGRQNPVRQEFLCRIWLASPVCSDRKVTV